MTISTSTVQFLIAMFIAACVLIIILGWVRVHNAEAADYDEHLANQRILRELQQIELHRPTSIIDKETP